MNFQSSARQWSNAQNPGAQDEHAEHRPKPLGEAVEAVAAMGHGFVTLRSSDLTSEYKSSIWSRVSRRRRAELGASGIEAISARLRPPEPFRWSRYWPQGK